MFAKYSIMPLSQPYDYFVEVELEGIYFHDFLAQYMVVHNHNTRFYTNGNL